MCHATSNSVLHDHGDRLTVYWLSVLWVHLILSDQSYWKYKLTFILFFSAAGNVMDHVIIERESESTIVFVEGARDAYLGYVTLKVSNLPNFRLF